MNKLLTYFYRIRHSLWFIPSIIILSSFSIFYLLNTTHLESSEMLHYFYQKHWDGFLGQSAYNLLIVSSNVVVTIFALSISLTMIVLTLVSGQIGSRILDHFLGNKVTQVVLGLYLGTILFLMLLSARIGSETPQEHMPLLAITFGFILVIISPALMVYFIQHLALSIIPDNVITTLSDSLSSAVQNYLKIETGNGSLRREKLTKLEHVILRSKASGYLSNIKAASLVKFLEEKDYLLDFNHLPGRFIIEGAEIGKIYSKKNKVDPQDLEAINDFIELSSQMPVIEDVEFFLRQMVEIALRALSPGINDPYTAHACLNYMFKALQRIALSDELPRGIYLDDNKKPRLYLPLFTLENMYDLALNEIQEASLSHINTQIYILEFITLTLSSPVNVRAKKHLVMHAKEIIKYIRQRTDHLPLLEKLDSAKDRLKLLS